MCHSQSSSSFPYGALALARVLERGVIAIAIISSRPATARTTTPEVGPHSPPTSTRPAAKESTISRLPSRSSEREKGERRLRIGERERERERERESGIDCEPPAAHGARALLSRVLRQRAMCSWCVGPLQRIRFSASMVAVAWRGGKRTSERHRRASRAAVAESTRRAGSRRRRETGGSHDMREPTRVHLPTPRTTPKRTTMGLSPPLPPPERHQNV